MIRCIQNKKLLKKASMDKKTLLILATAFLFLSFYPTILRKFYPEYGKPTVVEQAKEQTKESAPGSRQSSATSEPMPVNTMLRAEDFLAAEDVPFRNDKLNLVFNQKGGGIREIAFLDYMNSETKEPIKLLSLKDSKAAPTSVSFITPASAPAQPVYRITEGRDEMVLHTAVLSDRLHLTKTVTFDPSGYSATVVLLFQNNTDTPLDLRYELFAGSRIIPRHTIDTQYIEANFFSAVNGKSVVRHVNETRLGKEVRSDGPVGWLAIKDRHFSVILQPKSEKNFTGLVRGLGERHLAASLVSPVLMVPARGEVRHEFLLYMGPNEVKELLPLGLDAIVNFGKLDSIAKLLLGGLEILNKIFRNYGLSIIALTMLINLLLFPLTRASYMSMKRMQLVQPQMNKLKELHKKNPERLNKEMMELYKKNKVNPLGGCLPMILQMPVFIALYVALSKSSMLINSGLLWIRDLSSPDRVLLPFSLPFLGSEIHVLPLVMCVAMAFQQRMTQVPLQDQDPAMAQQQKMMSIMMPVIFGFIFYSMPSGLVLYWLTNTLLMTLYQLRLKNMKLS
jgi:YidC/Oxa1 family membrane protein insertase